MDWFGFFDKEETAKGAPTVQPAMVEGELAGLNLQQALEAHQAWKTKLQKVLSNTSEEKLELEIVAADNQCVLGKWIYKEGKSLYGQMPEYEFLRAAHAEFHICAGQVVEQYQLGNDVFADVILKTKFRTASNKNQMLLTDFFRVVKTR